MALERKRRPGRPRSMARFGRKRTPKVAKRKIRRTGQRERKGGWAPNPLGFSDSVLGPTDIQLAIFARGKIYQRMVRCGKSDCRCMHDGPPHGPYNYLVLPIPKQFQKRNGPRTKWIYISVEEAEEWKERIENYRRLQLLVWDQVMAEFGD